MWYDVSWQYRIRPTVLHSPWNKEANQGNLTNKFNDIEPNPAQVITASVVAAATTDGHTTDFSYCATLIFGLFDPQSCVLNLVSLAASIF